MALGMPPYYATYNGQSVTPYAGQKQPGVDEQRARMALGQRLAALQPSAYGAPTPMGAPAPGDPASASGGGGAGGIFSRIGAAASNPPAGSEADRKRQLVAAATSAGNFAGQGEAGYGAMTNELAGQRQFFNDMMAGRNSVATEQLRQGLQQQQALQQSMAAGASPQNSAMAARTAAMMMGRNAAGMTGQAALAQLAERQMAAEQLARLNLGQREQDINVGLGSRQNQMTGLGANKAEQPKGPSTTQQLIGGAAIAAGLLSDERLKENVRDGSRKARSALAKLGAKTYRYKDERHGKGEQFGFLAQDLEKAGLKSAVIETPIGKAIDVGKLAGANTGMLAELGKRVAKLEKGGRK